MTKMLIHTVTVYKSAMTAIIASNSFDAPELMVERNSILRTRLTAMAASQSLASPGCKP
jgi:hypothetical protein